MKTLSKSFVLLFSFLLFACATIDTFNKQVLIANTGVEQAAATATLLYDGGKLSKDQATDVYTRLTQVRQGIELARRVGDSIEGQDALTKAITLLGIVNEILEEHK